MRKHPVISREKTFAKLEYEPHSEAQRTFHYSDARFRIACCGRRFGKSQMSGHDLTAYAFTPDSYYWIVGPTYRLAEKEFRVVFHDLKKLGILPKCKKSYNVKQGDMRIETPWNSIIECVSADNPASLLGEGLDGVIMSEAARHSMSTWEAYIEPALSDKLGWADFPSTPRGFNWFKGLFDVGQLHTEPDYESWHYPTWLNSIRFPGGFDLNCLHPRDNNGDLKCKCNTELVRLQRRVSEQWFLQEYGAKFTAYEGLIYPDFDEEIHVRPIEYNPQFRNYWTLDFGYSDPFVCLDVMVDPSDNVYVWREYQVRYQSTWEHGLRLKSRNDPEGYHVDAITGDPRGADEIATLALQGYHVDVDGLADEGSWTRGIEAVRRQLKLQDDGKPKLYIDPSCKELIRQIQGLRQKEVREDKNAKSSARGAKEGQHDYDDHGPDALRYFCSWYFVLGRGASLSDLYPSGQIGTEAETFFVLNTEITLDSHIGYG
jgi:hypothetical protein